MKKLLILTCVAASFYGTSALAKTEGNYAGVDLLSGSASYNKRYSDDYQVSATETSAEHGKSNLGLGVNYKHAYNFNGAFVAGGVFGEQNNIKNETNQYEKLEVKNRFGVKADFGYDITDNVAPYVTVGYAGVAYRTRNYPTSQSGSSIKNGVARGGFYGVGLKIDINKDLSFNTEYQVQNFRAKTRTNGEYNYSGVYKANFSEIKLGLSHKF